MDHLNRADTRAVSAETDARSAPMATYRCFAEDTEIRALVLGDEGICPPLPPGADTAVFFDLPWDPTVVVDRVNKLANAIAGRKKLTLLQLLAPGTVEEWLFDLYRDSLQVYTPATPIWHAFQAVMHESETFPGLVRDVAVAGFKGCHGTQRARNLQERIAGVGDHVGNALRHSADILRLVRRKGIR